MAADGAAVLKGLFEKHEVLVKYAEAVKSEVGSYIASRPKRPR